VPDLAAAKKIYRIFSWASLAALVVVILLVLHKSPPPSVTNDPAAAKRVEQKFAAADQAKAAGQPAQVQMNGTELNSYLAQNLQLQGSPAQPGPSVPAPAASLPVAGASPATNGSADADPMAALASNDPQTIEQVQSSVKDVKVDMDGDLVKAYVIFNLPLELDGHLSAENGYVKFDPVAGKLGSMPLPQSTLEAAVSKMMSSPENREKLKLPNDISDIKIENGNAVLSYK